MTEIYTVSQINAYFKTLVASDEILSDVGIKGEISNFRHHHSGHMYFTLKDERAVVRCVMFSYAAMDLEFAPRDGMLVVARGYMSVYERDGQFQLVVKDMAEYGQGDLFAMFQQLKARLAEEGLFRESHKKALPFLPLSIGVVTSRTGAVINDIRNVLDRRFYNHRLILYPASVQGKGAEKEIIKGLDYFNRTGSVDVIILGRGGGSLEDLWPFNEESLARAIYRSGIPVVSAVGHETDYTISDFVADLRAPTPSAAAELVMPEKSVLSTTIRSQSSRLSNAMQALVRDREKRIEGIRNRPVFKRPLEYVLLLQMNLDFIAERFRKSMQRMAEGKQEKLSRNGALLEALGPAGVLNRGYSITYKADGILRSIRDVEEGDIVVTELKDGKFAGKVTGKEDRNEESDI
ncbi:MAG: exodeoxyribonuclease VII large subunit [Clostridia bacterium]